MKNDRNTFIHGQRLLLQRILCLSEKQLRTRPHDSWCRVPGSETEIQAGVSVGASLHQVLTNTGFLRCGRIDLRGQMVLPGGGGGQGWGAL